MSRWPPILGLDTKVNFNLLAEKIGGLLDKSTFSVVIIYLHTSNFTCARKKVSKVNNPLVMISFPRNISLLWCPGGVTVEGDGPALGGERVSTAGLVSDVRRD